MSGKFVVDLTLSYPDSTSKFLKELSDMFPDKPVMVQLERQDTPEACGEAFMKFVNMCHYNPDMPKAVTISAVGLIVGGRDSAYDLWWFASRPNYAYAFDVGDGKYGAAAKLF